MIGTFRSTIRLAGTGCCRGSAPPVLVGGSFLKLGRRNARCAHAAAVFTLLSGLLLSARSYHSEDQLRLREAQAKTLHPYKP